MIILIARMTFNSSLSCLMSKVSIEITTPPSGMSAPNSGMAIHRLVLIVDRFSLHCNSIQSPVSIVHLRVILTYLIPLLRVYINQHSSNAHSVQFHVQFHTEFQLVQQCIQISTRINSSMYIVHTSFVSFETPLHLHYVQQWFVDQ